MKPKPRAGARPESSPPRRQAPPKARSHTHGPGCDHGPAKKAAPHPDRDPDRAPEAASVRGVERDTRQRRAIREAISRANRPLTPAEIHAEARDQVQGLGLATVYRTLRILADEGVIAEVQVPGEAPRYEMADKAHHHHFYCRSCERVFEVEGCPGDLAGLTPPGFALDGHELLLFGTCADCRNGARP